MLTTEKKETGFICLEKIKSWIQNEGINPLSVSNIRGIHKKKEDGDVVVKTYDDVHLLRFKNDTPVILGVQKGEIFIIHLQSVFIKH